MAKTLTEYEIKGGVFCEITISFKDAQGFHGGYCKCDKPAKYIVSYNTGVEKNKRVSQLMCGIHKVATEKSAARIKKKTGFDSHISIEAIPSPPQPIK